MNLISFPFFLFLFLVFLSYYLIPIKNRWVILLLFSVLFYCFQSNILYLLGSSILTYLFSVWIEKGTSQKQNKQKLIAGIFIHLFLLFTLKYDLYRYITGANLLVPLGISYYTLSSLSYLIDVYQKKIKTNGFFRFFLCISFFPTLILGPINRYQKVEKTLFSTPTFQRQKIVDGFLRILYGIFKKLLIANPLFLLINYIVTENIGGVIPILGLLLYGIQIYADFSGGIDIVLGFSTMLQIDLEENFETPYFSKNLTQFWNRWHMSLSHWLKDYVYRPLGGNQKGKWARNILIVFLLSGLWHGVSWNFLLWGLLSGIFLILEKKCSYDPKKRIAILGNYCFVCLLWIFFMYPNLESILSIFQASKFTIPLFQIMSPMNYGILCLSILFLGFVDYQKYHQKKFSFLGRNRDYLLLIGFLLVIILFGNYGFSFVKTDFIYSRF